VLFWCVAGRGGGIEVGRRVGKGLTERIGSFGEGNYEGEADYTANGVSVFIRRRWGRIRVVHWRLESWVFPKR